jgi:hypothetical protein
MKRGLKFVVILLVSVLFFPQSSNSFYPGKTEQDQIEYARDHLIVKFKPEIDKRIAVRETAGKVFTGFAKVDELNAKFSVRKQERLFKEFKETALKSDKLRSFYILKVPEGTDLRQMKEAYEKLSEVEYVELDHVVNLFDSPNDPLFAHQWYLNNTGQGYLGVKRIEGNYK